MIKEEYAKAYKEVLEIIKYLPKEELEKIPKEKIDYFKDNMDKTYEFTINPRIDLEKQNVSNIASAIIVNIYREHFLEEEQKIAFDQLVSLQQEKNEEKKREEYNPDVFSKRKSYEKIESEKSEEKSLKEYNDSFMEKFKRFVKKVLSILKTK